MSFQPLIVGSGLTAWTLLKRTMPDQIEALASTGAQTRAATYFTETIGGVTSAEALVNDRQLAQVALGAFDLLDDLNSRFFVTKVLEEGADDADALANKLQDERYRQLAQVFDFSAEGGTDFTTEWFQSSLLSRYQALEFERAVGEQDSDLRMGLTLERSLPELAASTASNDAAWFKIMGSTALRDAFETIFSLPSSFSQLDLDKQLATFKARSEARFGTDSVADLSEAHLGDVVQTYLLQSQVNSGATLGAQSIALQLLQAG